MGMHRLTNVMPNGKRWEQSGSGVVYLTHAAGLVDGSFVGTVDRTDGSRVGTVNRPVDTGQPWHDNEEV